MTERIVDRGVISKSTALANKKVAIAVCGGIASVEVVKIIREIRRHGATVWPFMTSSAEKFITPLSLEWAAGRSVVRNPESEVRHLESFDLVLVAPATLNTISKAALGLTDNSVTLLIGSQIGERKPVIWIPTMNAQLYSHPLFTTYKTTLTEWGNRFFESDLEEDRLKMPSPEKVAKEVMDCLA